MITLWVSGIIPCNFESVKKKAQESLENRTLVTMPSSTVMAETKSAVP